MSFKIIYTTKVEEKEEPIGKIVFFDKYQPSSPSFPYFYLSERNEILNYSNWPDLVPYFYDKTLGFFVTIASVYQYKNNFSVYSLTASNSIITLKFIDTFSVRALRALDEDRKLHFLENNSFSGWNRTFTPTSDITINNVVYLFKDTNYYINDINITSDINATLTFTASVQNVTETLTSGKNIEFGLHRIPGKTRFESVFYSGLKGKAFATSDSLDLIPGVRTRSNLMGHAHDHTHTLNNHTHSFPHTHDLSNHSHYMNHLHGYSDRRNGDLAEVRPWAPFFIADLGINIFDVSRNTESTRDYTDGPTNNNTGSPSTSTTSDVSNSITSNVRNKTTDIDNINSNVNNLKIGDKTYAESYPIFAYLYAARYFPPI